MDELNEKGPEIVALIGMRAYGSVMSNLTRPSYVEGLVSLLLGKRWRYLGDWDGWDLERDDGKRLEVKQSAARQPWTDRPGREGRETIASFDIAPRKGYWADGGKRWVVRAGRHADLFVFAHHPVLNAIECDQRDAKQWHARPLRLFADQVRRPPPMAPVPHMRQRLPQDLWWPLFPMPAMPWAALQLAERKAASACDGSGEQDRQALA